LRRGQRNWRAGADSARARGDQESHFLAFRFKKAGKWQCEPATSRSRTRHVLI
jgi:hypothetical protein